MSPINRFADIFQKGAVLGLSTVFLWQVYQIGAMTYEHKFGENAANQHKIMLSKIAKAVEEDDKYKNDISKIPDRYDADDDSYKKRQPKLN
jgi:hypothetical protein